MRALLGAVLACLIALPAMAQCNPPPGLALQPWYSMCGGTLQQLYQQGAGQGAPFDAFVMGVYQRYAAASTGVMRPQPQMSPAMPAPQVQMPNGAFGCSVGATRCTNGWVYRCNPVGTNTMWQTGSQRC